MIKQTNLGVNSFDGHQFHTALLQAVGEHGPEDRGRGGQHHLVSHKVHRLQVLVAHAQRDVAQLPLQPQLVHDGEGGRRVALERVAEDAVAIARGRSHQRFVFCQTLRHFLPFLLLFGRFLKNSGRRYGASLHHMQAWVEIKEEFNLRNLVDSHTEGSRHS